MTKKSFGPI
jgi:hypothetical protein